MLSQQIEPLLFSRGDRVLLKIDVAALLHMLPYRQITPKANEAGGVLMGRHILNCHDVVVDEVTTPCWCDKRTRFSFHRSEQHHQRALDKAWKNSGGTCGYLGEWHTHPEPDPTPSHIDLNDWKTRLQKDKFDTESLFFVIIGQQKISAWEGLRSSLEIQKLERL